MLKIKNPKGFTLIEILVSVAIFTIVMVIALGALLAMTESDRKAQTLKSVINNLNFSLDAMSRTIRTGTDYHCGSGTLTTPLDCENPSTQFAFRSAEGLTVSYRLSGDGVNNWIERSSDGGSSWARLTSPEVRVSRLDFYVTGSSISDDIQPKVSILLSGTVLVSSGKNSNFYLQTTVTQRIYDQ